MKPAREAPPSPPARQLFRRIDVSFQGPFTTPTSRLAVLFYRISMPADRLCCFVFESSSSARGVCPEFIKVMIGGTYNTDARRRASLFTRKVSTGKVSERKTLAGKASAGKSTPHPVLFLMIFSALVFSSVVFFSVPQLVPQEAQPASSPQAPLTLTLQDALARARNNSVQFQAALVDQGVAHEDKVQARAALLPSLNYNNTFTYTQPNGTTSGVF